MDASPKLVRRKDVLWRSFNGLLVVGPQDGEPTAFSGSASLVWHLLETATTLVDLTTTLAHTTGASLEVVRCDLEGLLAEFQRIRVVDLC